MIDDTEIIKNPKELFQYKVILYGAGRNGEKMYHLLEGSGVTMYAFCDSDPEKWNRKKLSLMICPLHEIMVHYRKERMIFIITSVQLREITGVLQENGVRDSDIYSSFTIMHSVRLNMENTMFPETYKNGYVRKYNCWHKAWLKKYHYLKGFDDYVFAWNQFYQDNPILVYQFGKVGSSSMSKGLREIGFPTIQTHALAYDGIFMDKEMKDMYQLFIESLKSKEEVKIITIVREPVIRDISFVFEHMVIPYISIFDDFTRDFNASVLDILENKVFFKKADLKDVNPVDYHFKYKLRGLGGNIFQWYQNEMEHVFGIDILRYPFDKANGYGMIQKENIRVLVLKLEKLAQNEQRIAEFVGNRNFRLIDENRSANKNYYYVYENFIRSIKLSDEYINRYYLNNKYMDHFYSSAEQLNFLGRWKK